MDTSGGVGVVTPEADEAEESLGWGVGDINPVGSWVGDSMPVLVKRGVEEEEEVPLPLPPLLPVLAADAVALEDTLPPASKEVPLGDGVPTTQVGDMRPECVDERVPTTTLCVAPSPKEGEAVPLPPIPPPLPEGDGLKDTLGVGAIDREPLLDTLDEGLWERLGMEEGAWEGEGGVESVASPGGDTVPPPEIEGEEEEEGEPVVDTDTSPVLDTLGVVQGMAELVGVGVAMEVGESLLGGEAL